MSGARARGARRAGQLGRPMPGNGVPRRSARLRAHRRPDARYLALVALSLVAAGATTWADTQLQSALQISPGNEFTKRAYPLTVRAGLLDVVALVAVIAVASLSPAIGATSGERRWALPRWTWVLVVAAALLNAPFGVVSAFVAGLFALAAALLVRHLVGGPDHLAYGAAMLGYLARVVAGVLISAVGIAQHGLPIVFDDERAFHEAGLQMPTILLGGYGDLDYGVQHVIGHFLDMVGVIYTLIGSDFVAIRLLNALFGAITVAMVYVLARHLFSAHAARVVAWSAALWPAFVFWGGTGLREPYAVMLGLLVPWLVVRTGRLPAADRILLVSAGGLLTLVSMASVRWYSAAALGLALLLGSLAAQVNWLPTGRRRLAAPLAVLLAVAVLAVALSGSGEPNRSFVQQLTPRALEYRMAVMQLTPLVERDPAKQPIKPDESYVSVLMLVRVESASSGRMETAIIADYLVQPRGYVVAFADGHRESVPLEAPQALSDTNVGWQDVLGRVPDGAAIALLPLGPWSAAPSRRYASTPDTLLFGALVVLALVGIRRGRHTRSFVWWTLLVYGSATLAAVIGFSTNLGTALRQRTSDVPWLLILAAPALVPAWDGLLERAARRGVAWQWRAGAPAPPRGEG